MTVPWVVMGCGLLIVAACATDEGDDVPIGGGPNDTSRCSESADTCVGETVCVAGSCVAAYPRIYAISSINVTVPTTKSDGTPWDIGGGAPDLFVQVNVNGTLTGISSVKADAFSASFAGPFPAPLIAGSTLVLSALDEDLTVDDPAYSCAAAPLSMAQLRGRQLSCGSGGYQMTFRVEPQ